jgi:DNA polymerase III sliding clamp (beta) subunit (PCNA family)
MEVNYPNYRQVIPKEKVKLGEVATDELKSLVARCLVFTEQSEAKTIFEFSKKALTVSFVGDKNAQLKHALDGAFAPFTIALNARSIFKILSNIKSESVTLFQSGDELSPFRFETGDLMVLSMPIRMS